MHKMTSMPPANQKAAIDNIGHERGMSRSAIIREALVEYFRPVPMLRSIGMASEGSFDASKNEEYLADHWLSFLLAECGLPPDYRSPNKTSSD